MSSPEIKISSLSANYNINQPNAYFVMVDAGNVTQGVSGSTMKTPGSALSTMVWSNSGQYGLTDLTTIVNTYSSNMALIGRRTSTVYGIIYESGSIGVDASAYDQFVIPLSASGLSANFLPPANAYDSQIIMWNIRYMVNTDEVSLDPTFRLPMTTLNWSLSAGRMDIFAAKYNGPDEMWDVISFAPGYIIF